MSEHTKEPWAVHPDAAGVIVASSDPDLSLLGLDIDGLASFMNEHDPRRVVACVNLCAGTPTESIEAAIAAGHTVDYIASRAEEMRDIGKSLLTMLKQITDRYAEDMTGVEYTREEIAMSRDLIAEVEASL